MIKIARRRRTYTRRIYTRARRGYHRRQGLLSGNVGKIVEGGIAGAAAGFIPQFLGKYTNPVVFTAAGYLLKKPGLFEIAGYEAGKALMAGNTISNITNNGFWEG